MSIGHLCLALSVIGLIACQSQNDPLSSALDIAGENRAELQTVLDYYSAPADSLKHRAVHPVFQRPSEWQMALE